MNKPARPHAALERWIWILIYGGLFALILGLAVGRVEPALGWTLGIAGAAIAVVGIVLIYVRARLGPAR